MRKTTPYNTGKVAIGSRYEPVVSHTMSLDELRIQDSLINPPVKLLVMPYDKAIYVLGVVALVVIYLTN
jgi:hypothetical protein